MFYLLRLLLREDVLYQDSKGVEGGRVLALLYLVPCHLNVGVVLAAIHLV